MRLIINVNCVHIGRRYVALSLAEAETLRRVLHMRKHAASYLYTAGDELLSEDAMLPLLDGHTATLALRCILDGFRATDAAHGYFDAGSECYSAPRFTALAAQSILASSSFMQSATEQILRFFNNDMFFSPHNLNVLLRAMHDTTKRDRKTFFKHVLSCRRRAAKKWLESSVAKLFALNDQFAMLKHRAMAFRFVSAIKMASLSLHDAFNKFDFDKNGLLSPGEVWGGFESLHIPLSAMDVLDFVSSADVDRDGNVSMKELAMALEDPEKAERERRRLEQSEDAIFLARAGLTAPVPSVATSLFMDISEDGEALPTVVGTIKDDDEDDEEELLPGPPRLQRNLSGGGSSIGGGSASTDGTVLPKGEEELRALQARQVAEEEAAEARESATEMEQEMHIQREIEVEEDENDRLQEGGPNPSISGKLPIIILVKL